MQDEIGDDFHPMRALLAPGVALMNRLRYPQKFALVSLVFAIPLGLMMYLWLAEIEDRLAFARKERAGLEYVVALRRLLEPLAIGASEVAEVAREIDAVDGRLGTELRRRRRGKISAGSSRTSRPCRLYASAPRCG